MIQDNCVNIKNNTSNTGDDTTDHSKDNSDNNNEVNIKDRDSGVAYKVMSTHINDQNAMRSVPRLPANMVVRVFDQNSADTFHDYRGSQVLITEGAKTYAKFYEMQSTSSAPHHNNGSGGNRGLGNIPPRKRMQHCAHFRLKDLCRLGASCRFLHVLPTSEEIIPKGGIIIH